MNFALLPVALVLICTLFFLIRELWRQPNKHKTSYEAANAAATLMKDWGVWMTTVSTAVIGASGFLLDSNADKLARQYEWAIGSVLMFGLSIVFAAWTLGALPSIVTRLAKEATEDSDLYEISLFSFVKVRTGVVAALQHVFFVLGLLLLHDVRTGRAQAVLGAAKSSGGFLRLPGLSALRHAAHPSSRRRTRGTRRPAQP